MIKQKSYLFIAIVLFLLPGCSTNHAENEKTITNINLETTVTPEELTDKNNNLNENEVKNLEEKKEDNFVIRSDQREINGKFVTRKVREPLLRKFALNDPNARYIINSHGSLDADMRDIYLEYIKNNVVLGRAKISPKTNSYFLNYGYIPYSFLGKDVKIIGKLEEVTSTHQMRCIKAPCPGLTVTETYVIIDDIQGITKPFPLDDAEATYSINEAKFHYWSLVYDNSKDIPSVVAITSENWLENEEKFEKLINKNLNVKGKFFCVNKEEEIVNNSIICKKTVTLFIDSIQEK